MFMIGQNQKIFIHRRFWPPKLLMSGSTYQVVYEDFKSANHESSWPKQIIGVYAYLTVPRAAPTNSSFLPSYLFFQLRAHRASSVCKKMYPHRNID
jgi:hypothetical protein